MAKEYVLTLIQMVSEVVLSFHHYFAIIFFNYRKSLSLNTNTKLVVGLSQVLAEFGGRLEVVH